MDPDFAHLAAPWRDSYLLVGTAAATHANTGGRDHR
jgi:hypothetical protein